MKDSIRIIELNDEKLKGLKAENLIAITIAEGGAMGDPGAIEIVDKDLKLYHTHFGEVDDQILRDLVPFLNTLRIGFGEIEGLDEGWAGLYTGYGNYLFVRPKYEKPIIEYIDAHYSDTGMPKVVELYSHWYEALKEAVKADGETEAKLKEFRQIWQDFFEDLTAEMSQECKDFVKTKEGRAKFMHWYYEGDHDEYPWAFFTEENMKLPFNRKGAGIHKITEKFVEYCRKNYGEELGVADERSYCYKSLPICIVDCVYSLRARYNSVTVPIVERYADAFLSGDKTSTNDADNLTNFIKNLTTPSLKSFADNIAKNHQVLGRVPKEEVCLDVAKTLRGLGIETFQDFQNYPSREELADAIKSVKGMGNAGVNYLFMLTGDDNKSKPDVHIHRCIAEACGENVSDEECQEIIEEASRILKQDYPGLTVRKLDGVIWRDFSSRRG